MAAPSGSRLAGMLLAAIMVAGGLAAAVPGAAPEAHAAVQQTNTHLYVSAEGQADNRIGHANIIEVIVDDPAIRDTSGAAAAPDVRVNGALLGMLQGSDGKWYAYMADRNSVTKLDRANHVHFGYAAGEGLDYGAICGGSIRISGMGSGAAGIALPSGGDLSAVPGLQASCGPGVSGQYDASLAGHALIREPPALSNPAANGLGQAGLLSADLWPFVQLYSFSSAPDYSRMIDATIAEAQRGADMYDRLGAAAALAAITSESNVQFTAAEREWLASHPEIRLGYAPGWAPLEYVDGGILMGLSADIAAKFSRLSGSEFKAVPGLTWSQSLDHIRDKRVDLVLMAQDTADRRDSYGMEFTRPWLNITTDMITRGEIGGLSAENLGNYRVVSVAGYAVNDWLDDNGIGYTEVDSYLGALQALSDGTADVFLDVGLVANHRAAEAGITGLTISGSLPAGQSYMLSAGYHRDNAVLGSIVQKMLDNIPAEKKGTDAIPDPSDNYYPDQFYVFISDLATKRIAAHGADESRVGVPSTILNRSDKSIDEINRILDAEGATWVQYTFNNPTTGLDEVKRSYIIKRDNYIIGSGYYPDWTVDVKYHRAGAGTPESVTLLFKDPGESAMPSQMTYAPGSDVIVSITDYAMNIDPTDEDVWVFATQSDNAAFYNLLDEHGAGPGFENAIRDGRVNADFDLSQILSEGFGDVRFLDDVFRIDRYGGGAEAQLDCKLTGTYGQNPALAGLRPAVDAGGHCILHGDMAGLDLFAIGFVESGANDAVFTNVDAGGSANLVVRGDAGGSFAIGYADPPPPLAVGAPAAAVCR